MSAYAKTMDNVTDAEYTDAMEAAPKHDPKEALEDMSVEELRVLTRSTLGASAWISIARKEALIDALVDGKLPTNRLPTAPAITADIADLLAQAVAKHFPKAGGMDEEAIRLIANQELAENIGQFDEQLVRINCKVSDLEANVVVKFNAILEGMGDIANKMTKEADKCIEGKINDAVDSLTLRVAADQEKRTSALRADFENMAIRAMDTKMDSMGDAITVKLSKRLIKEIVIKRPDGVKVPVGAQHEQFPELLQVLSCGLNVFLVGPAAAGKTRAAEEAAKALDLAFYPQSFNAQTPSSQIFGYMDAQGRYVSTVFRDAFEKGGLWLADEIDRGNGNVLTALNAALENGYCSFPDGVVKRHEKFLCVASANTWGRGADRTYVGANALDEATLDRFIQMEWNYDENLERLLAGNPTWVERVQAIRKAVFDERVRLLVSPRASFRGARLLAAGVKWARVEELTLWKGTDKATREKVLARAPKLVTRIQIEGVE